MTCRAPRCVCHFPWLWATCTLGLRARSAACSDALRRASGPTSSVLVAGSGRGLVPPIRPTQVLPGARDHCPIDRIGHRQRVLGCRPAHLPVGQRLRGECAGGVLDGSRGLRGQPSAGTLTFRLDLARMLSDPGRVPTWSVRIITARPTASVFRDIAGESLRVSWVHDPPRSRWRDRSCRGQDSSQMSATREN